MDNMKKGKIAEKIVEGMFKEAGFKVVKAGYESTFSKLADQYNLIQGPAAGYIRHHPDFIVVDKSNHAYLIEVKFRRFGVIDQKDLFNYPETQVVLLTKDSFHCQHLKDIHKNGKKFLPLGSMKPFSDIPEKIVLKYILKTRRLLGDENLFGQFIEKASQKIVGKDFMQPNTLGEVRFSYIEDYNKEGDTYEAVGKTEVISNEQGKSIVSRDGKSWTKEEVNSLEKHYLMGMSVPEMARKLSRKEDAVIFKLMKTGIIPMRQATDLLGGKNVPRKKRNREDRNRTAPRKRSDQPRRNKKKRTTQKRTIRKKSTGKRQPRKRPQRQRPTKRKTQSRGRRKGRQIRKPTRGGRRGGRGRRRL